MFRFPAGSPATRLLSALCFCLVICSFSFAHEELVSYSPDANAARESVPELYKWQLTPLFSDQAEWAAAVDGLRDEVSTLAKYEGKLQDPAKLAQCLGLYFRLHDEINRTTLYANLLLTTAQSDDAIQAMQKTSLSLMDALMGKVSFIRGEVLALSEEQMAAAYASQAPLREYRVYIDNLRRRRPRVLGPEAEKVLTLAGDNLWAEIDLNEIPSGFETTFDALMTDIAWPKVHDEEGRQVQMTLANYGRFRGSSKREVRREAVAAFFGTLRQHEHAFAATLGGQYAFNVFLARARGYDTAIEAYLDKDNLEVAVYENLIETVNKNLEPLHRYVQLRKKALGYEDLHIYDLYVPLVPSADEEIPFGKARETVLAALEPLGPEVHSLLSEGLDPHNGWMDLYPSRDKESGAFSANVYGRHPYVMMNYQDSAEDMFTLAHEFGHAVHSALAMKNQPYSSFRYVPFLAEIASTCNEAILGDYLVEHAVERDYKAALLAKRLESIRTTIYRQALFAEFEQLVHGYVEAGRPITAALLEESYEGLIRRYYGPGFSVDENDGMEWAYIPHLYYKYYVFTYSTGLSSGIALADKVRNGGPEAVRKYLSMLEGGCSKPPLELLKGAGVDLTKPAAIESALRSFSKTMDELEALLDH